MKRWPVGWAALVLLLWTVPGQAGLFETWNYQLRASFTNYTKTETLTNFPVLVVLSTNIPGFTYSGFNSPVNGADLRFSSSNENTELNYEVESWNTNGNSYVWVQVPALASTNDYIYAYWGKATNAPPCLTNGLTWDTNNVGVWHMAQTNAQDSTSNRFNGTVVGAVTQVVAGKINGADDFHANTDFVSVPANSAFTLANAYSVSAWVQLDPCSNDYMGIVGNFTNSAGFILAMRTNALAPPYELGFWANGWTWSGVGIPTNGTWKHIAYTRNGATGRFYVDGAVVSNVSATAGTVGGQLQLGAAGGGWQNRRFDGRLDEVRIARTAYSSNWMWACWLNQAANTAFVSYGSIAAMTTLTVRANAATSITANSATVGGTILHAGNAENPQVYVCWDSTDKSTNSPTDWAHVEALGTNWGVGQSFSTTLSNLIASSNYAYRCYVTNSTGGDWSDQVMPFTAACTLVIQGRPANYGSPLPDAYGTNAFPFGTTVTNSVASPTNATTTLRRTCLGWNTTLSSDGSPVGSGTSTQAVVQMTNNQILTWNWTNEWSLTLTNSAGGTNEAKAGWYTNGIQVSVSAFPTGSYHFVGWSGDVPAGSATNNPISVTLNQALTLRSQFSTAYSNLTLIVTGLPSTYGLSAPLNYGTYSSTIADGAWVTNSVFSPTNASPVIRRACAGWTLAYTNGTPLTSGTTTQAIFQLLASDTLTWIWTNEYYLGVGTNTGGTATTNVSGWYTSGTTATVSATATGSYAFLQWMGNVPAGAETSNPVTLTMEVPRAIVPVFVENATNETKVWSGVNNWSSGTNWTPPGVPGPEDDVIIRTGTVVLAGPTRIASLVVSNGATLMFTNWNSRLTVTGSAIVRSNALVTLPASFNDLQQSNNIYMACNTMLVEAGARISADALGYLGAFHTGQGYGPGRASHGVSYGGWGGGSGLGAGPYGSVQDPTDPGSGGGGGNTGGKCGGDGGGAIRIEVAGLLGMHGSITANGQQGIKAGNGEGSSGGSGGSIFITCGALDSTNGTISANGGARSTSTTNPMYGSGGGRIAIVYTNDVLQAATPRPTAQISANDGYSPVYSAQPGTVYFNGPRAVPETWNGGSAQLYGPSTLEVPRLTFVTNWIQLPQTGMLFKVTDALTVVGTNAPGLRNGRLQLLTNVILQTGGDLVMTNGASFYVQSGPTPDTFGTNYGALVNVGGSLVLCSNSWIYSLSATNGGSPLFQVQNLLVKDAASGISADTSGFQRNPLNSNGNGPGRGYGGASYGGRGGNNSTYGPYGSSNAPVDAGSSGSSGNGPLGGSGGGVIRVEASRAIVMNGILTADGGAGEGWNGSQGNGGSGGSVYLTCHIFDGSASGSIGANGGNGGATNGASLGGAGGGGGRVAVWSVLDTYAGTLAALAGSNVAAAATACSNGTVVRATSAAPFLVSNVTATVMGTAADVVGSLTATSAVPTEVYCYWGTTDGSYWKQNWATNNHLGACQSGLVTNHVSSLQVSTLYYYRFYATNALGETWSITSGVFTTSGGPVLDNGSGAVSLTPASAVLCGTVVGGDPAPEVSIYWGPTDGGVPPGTWSNRIDMGTLAAGTAFSNVAAGMWANQTNYYRCYGTNANGPGYALSSAVFRTLSPTVTVSPATITEGNPPDQPSATFALSLSVPSALPVSVDYFTRNGVAVSNSDYVASTGTVTFAVGVTNASVSVTVNGDLIDEYPSENFYLVLTNASWLAIGTTQAEATIVDDDYVPDAKSWSGTGDWMNGAAWTPVGPPSPGDWVTIPANATCVVSRGTASLASLTNNGILICSNWNSVVSAAAIVINGTVTLPPAFNDVQPSNNIYLACDALTINAGGRVDADSKGYVGAFYMGNGYGPGRGYGGASYGGRGGGNVTLGPYGNPLAPIDPGSGGGGGNTGVKCGGDGGGAIRLNVTGALTLRGTITANGQDGISANGTGGSGGSGGSIYLTCGTFDASNATVSANGGTWAMANSAAYPGGGGRIAVTIANEAAQAALPRPVVRFSATDGYPTNGFPQPGTIYFSSGLTFPEQWTGSAQLLGPSTLQVARVTFATNWIQLFQTGMVFKVTDSLTLSGTNAPGLRNGRIQLSNAVLQTDGDLLMANGATLHTYSGQTNTYGTNCGVLVTAGGTLALSGNSWIYPYSSTNGVGALFRVSSLTVDAGSGINADGKGFAGNGGGYGNGTGPGRGYGGASYGGWGGGNATCGPYGSSNAPVDSGSGGAGGNGPIGGWGGGIIHVEAQRIITLDGTLTASGTAGEGWNNTAGSGGSGGSIFLSCGRLSGAPSGVIKANGGNGGPANGTSPGGFGGGGGRIAVQLSSSNYSGQVSAAAGTNLATGTAPGIGTIVWINVPRAGSVFTFR